jgi:hypothetical protein
MLAGAGASEEEAQKTGQDSQNRQAYLDNRGVSERGDVSQLVVLEACNLAQNAAHDLACHA